MQKTKQKISVGAVLATAGLVALLTVSFLGFFAAAWYVRVYGRIGFDSILFTLTSSLGGVDQGLIRDFMWGAAAPTVLCTVAVSLILFWPGKKKLFNKTAASVISLVLCIGLLLHGLSGLGGGVAAASDHSQGHDQGQQQAEQLLSVLHLFFLHFDLV